MAKIRNPWAVAGLSLITFGVYYIFWWYFINREMRDLGDASGVDIGQSPGKSVLAITLGSFLIVPPFVSAWNTGRRMESVQRTVGVEEGSGPLFFSLYSIPLVVELVALVAGGGSRLLFLQLISLLGLLAQVYMQAQLNKAWRTRTSGGSELSKAWLAGNSTQSGLVDARGLADTEAILGLQRRRDQLNLRVAELLWDLGGLTYEMASRDTIRVDVLVKRAAMVQDADAELVEVERILRLEQTSTAGECSACGSSHSSGAAYCWQCGHPLLREVHSDAIAPR